MKEYNDLDDNLKNIMRVIMEHIDKWKNMNNKDIGEQLMKKLQLKKV